MGYCVLKELGTGTYGRATLCSSANQEAVVVKEVCCQNPSVQLAVFREIKILSELRHPFIVRYIDYFLLPERISIVMEYADGGDLSELIFRARRNLQTIPQRKIISWFAQLATAVKYLHDKRILHRDIKSSNVSTFYFFRSF